MNNLNFTAAQINEVLKEGSQRFSSIAEFEAAGGVALNTGEIWIDGELFHSDGMTLRQFISTDSEGVLNANIVPRIDTLDGLSTTVGFAGEIGVASDASALMVFSGGSAGGTLITPSRPKVTIEKTLLNESMAKIPAGTYKLLTSVGVNGGCGINGMSVLVKSVTPYTAYAIYPGDNIYSNMGDIGSSIFLGSGSKQTVTPIGVFYIESSTLKLKRYSTDAAVSIGAIPGFTIDTNTNVTYVPGKVGEESFELCLFNNTGYCLITVYLDGTLDTESAYVGSVTLSITSSTKTCAVMSRNGDAAVFIGNTGDSTIKKVSRLGVTSYPLPAFIPSAFYATDKAIYAARFNQAALFDLYCAEYDDNLNLSDWVNIENPNLTCYFTANERVAYVVEREMGQKFSVYIANGSALTKIAEFSDEGAVMTVTRLGISDDDSLLIASSGASIIKVSTDGVIITIARTRNNNELFTHNTMLASSVGIVACPAGSSPTVIV